MSWRAAMASGALRSWPRESPWVSQAERQLRAGRRESTWGSYSSKFALFVRFCASVCVPPREFLPATTETVLGFLGWLQWSGRVAHGSLQQYMSAVNAAHVDNGFDKPAVGHLVRLARKGYGDLEVQREGPPNQRAGLPAEVVWQIMLVGLATVDLLVLRAAAALVVTYCFFARADSGVRAEEGRLTVDVRGIHFSEDAKNLERWRPAVLSYPWPDGDFMATPHALLARFFAARAAAFARAGERPAKRVWQLPREREPTPADFGEWLRALLAATKAVPPPGLTWTKHSLRGGAASAALSVGAQLPAVCRWGVWKTLASVLLYLDPLVRRCPPAVVFFAHLLTPGESAHLHQWQSATAE